MPLICDVFLSPNYDILYIQFNKLYRVINETIHKENSNVNKMIIKSVVLWLF